MMRRIVSFFRILVPVGLAAAQPASVSFTNCLSGDNSASASQGINVTAVYSQIVENGSKGKALNFTVIGNTGKEIVESSNETHLLATLFTTAQILTFSVTDTSINFCDSLRPPSPLPSVNGSDYCPIPPGPVAFSSTISLSQAYELETLSTQLRAVDTSSPALELACVNVEVTPLVPSLQSPYGHARIILWVTGMLAVSYWVLVGIARIVGAWDRGVARTESGLWPRMKSAGYILASALSGDRLTSTPALLRFATPSLRDVILFTQWCAAIGMVAVQWPRFVYPFFVQTAWAALVYNITFTQGQDHRWDPLSTPPFNPPSNFADQLSDPTSPLYLNASIPNQLFMLPEDVQDGLSSFAYTLGVRPQDLFGLCLGIFLCIIGATISISAVLWGLDWVVSSIIGLSDRRGAIRGDAYSPRYSNASKDILDSTVVEDGNTAGHAFNRRAWWRHRLGQSSFHGSVLIGNLVRLLVFFHFPITLFSSYQFALGPTHASTLSVALAIVCFVVFSISLPTFLTFRVMTTPTGKLFAETHTLLALGPLYNTFNQGSQSFAGLLFLSNLILGVTIGCGQKSGSAQAIIILVVEVASALGASVWLPWGHGAAMGLISFLYCVARIIVAVLIIILAPIVSVGVNAGGWIAYAILFVLGLIYLAMVTLLFFKLVEAILRVSAQVPFNRSKHTVDSGLLGVLGIMVGRSSSHSRRPGRPPYEVRTPSSRPGTPSSKQALAVHKANDSRTYFSQTSVLRPDEASRPYREENDDEGYIMGAWQPFPRTTYSPIQDKSAESPPPNKTGFSRVGGGRAHYETPYAIKPGTAQSTSTTERTSRSSRTRVPSDDFTMPAGSVIRQTPESLPAGAQPPFHVRTKSQTAIIEDASSLNLPMQPASADIIESWSGDDTPAVGPSIGATALEGATDVAQHKRRNWLAMFKGPRRESDPDRPEEHSDFSPGGNTGQSSSFVVIRNPRQQQVRRPSSYAEPSVFGAMRDPVTNGGISESPPRANSSPRLFTIAPASPTSPTHSRRLSSST